MISIGRKTMQLVMQNAMSCQTSRITSSQKKSKTCLLRKLLLAHDPEIQIEIPPLPESDLDLDSLAIPGDPIRRAFLTPHFFDAVASRISDLPMSTRRLHQIFEEADAPIKPEPVRFH
jgi:hypothetical protein